MSASWIADEMETATLPDKRLNARLKEILDQLASRPTGSIPSACGGYAETAAAYRFFDNDRVTFDDVLQPHIDATRRRIEEQSVVIMVQDTTEIDLTRPQQQVVGAGPMDGSSRRGIFMHLLHALTPDGTPLGTARAIHWAREEKTTPCSKLTSHQRIAVPIEQKESNRWITTLEHVRRMASELPKTQFVCVADSEADIYELMVAAMAEPRHADWIVRACHDRALPAGAKSDAIPGPEAHESDTSPQKLRGRVLATPVRFRQTIHIRERERKYNCEQRGRRQPRSARSAEVEVRSCRITLSAPWRPQGQLPDVSVNIVMVSEPNPPEGEPAVEWILLTSLPIETLDQVRQVIENYCVRWLIEVFFRTLKSGCCVEDRRFEHIDRMLPCLAIYLIVAWRTLYLCRLGRAFPEISCETVFEPAEWKSVYQVVHRKAPPAAAPMLAEMVRMVAQLGGYVNRKRDDPPGPQTIWLGLQRVHDISHCWMTFGPGASGDKVV
jgi:Transposase DNA-binding/Transposase Tn5 dimerisation domain/Transposase DDE domain